ncbi:5,6-dimethylbenzimidazole synthase [Rhodococcus sp. 14-2483-1-1]|nr:5,6-dimethylbenzimidazole synthase [Rhodococcus sp. WWJCD1]OZC90556.1 5,6-dimethylbenzimidazole synthase [Rhodococcus sp. 06-412-2C]OZC98187.1 5,6-dimethylbenzimidazole synthase [Rhodococcus sp. 06-412-2B]OZE80422.1 5,6-dimethylbenzimidazole synthase [Rhodococcus sp. 15-649-2-2]OZF35616.1 5,6-dimethylbenzimidazole synthase [Rhodococcus sp. 14-2483-1-1]
MTEAALSVYAAIRSRRDVRAEFDGTVVDDDTLRRILGAAHQAPSVGNTQPWDFVVVRKPDTLSAFAAHVAGCRQDFADKLDAERRKTFDPIRIEGIETSGTGVVVTYDPNRGGRHVLGRDTVDDTGLFSAVLAIENLWLAAIAENVGVGWVSFYDEAYLTELLDIPAPVRPIAWLCVGPVESFQEVPDLERFGWRSRRPLDDALHFEQYRR